jgi:plasmid maintenance system antidote protein VapI
MALRLELWLGTKNGGGASLWLSQQAAYDLWKTRKVLKLRIKHVAIPKQLALA